LFASCRARNDEIGKHLLAKEDGIREGNIIIKYHRDCRATYTSTIHISRVKEKQELPCRSGTPDSTLSEGSSASSTFTRSKSSASTFDWNTNCFICDQKCNPKHRSSWSMVETAIDPHLTKVYTKVLEAAKQRDDNEMLPRLLGVPHGDLVAIEAKYHRTKGCYSSYINARNIEATQTLMIQKQEHGAIIQALVDEYHSNIVDRSEVVLLSTMRARYCELASEVGMVKPESYTSQKLKRQFLQDYPEFALIPQPGKSDLVCASRISKRMPCTKHPNLALFLKNLTRMLRIFHPPGGIIGLTMKGNALAWWFLAPTSDNKVLHDIPSRGPSTF